MGKYLHKFDTVDNFEDVYDSEDYLEPWVSYTEEDEAVHYNKQPVQIPIRFYGDGSQLLLTKNTNDSVLTLTAEDIQTLAGSTSNYIVFDSTNSVMGAYLQNDATFNPERAYNNYGVGTGVNVSDAPVTIDFGENWLADVQDASDPDYDYLTVLACWVLMN